MSLEIGSKVKGVVKGITNFGAFVELTSGVTGLVHISEVADNYVKDVNDHLKINDEVEVKILSEKDGKIALSIKKANERKEDERSSYSQRPQSRNRSGSFNNKNHIKTNFQRKESFEDKLSKFLKTSEENLTSLKRNTETKRGGRGGRRV